jgi:hypothetical protein
MQYSVPFSLSLGTTVNVYKTLVGLIVPATGGIRCRPTRLIVNPGDVDPADRNIAVRLHRKVDATASIAGTAGAAIAAADVPKGDPASRDCGVVVNTNYSAEPTSMETHPVFQSAFNDRNGGVWEFNVDPDKPEAMTVANGALFLMFAPLEGGGTAAVINGTLEFEEY